jgi:ABC-2 type transport system permease protein
VRLQRASVLAWTAGVAVLGFVYGAISSDVQDYVGDNETLKQMMAAAGGPSLIDSYFGTSMLTIALVSAGFAVASVQRMRGEESALLAEPVLATPVARVRWTAAHLVVALGGSAVVMVGGGLGAGIPYAIENRDAHLVAVLLGAALVHLPAIWLLAGAATALFGIVPRALPAAWVLFLACFVVGFLGTVLRLPGWALDLSPFQHTPQLPAADLTLTPLAVLAAVAVALTVAGVAGFRHRDVG